jgi:hypothetical protein
MIEGRREATVRYKSGREALPLLGLGVSTTPKSIIQPD